MANNPYERLTVAIEEASDNPADKDWVQTAFVTLATNDVKAVTSESAINGVIRQVAETGQRATDLYGTPEEWAAEKITTWREKGTQAFSEDEPWALKEVMVAGFLTGAFFSILFWVVSVLPSDRPSSQPVAFYLLPAFLGFAVMFSAALFQRLRSKLGFTSGVAVSALIVLVLACGIAFLLFWSYEVVTATFPAWFHLPVAAGSALLGGLAALALPKGSTHVMEGTDNYSQPETWLTRFKQELWKRGDISDARVREEVSRVKEHARESGSSYLEEFGHPVAYARSLSEQKKVKPYRLYLYSLMMIACLGFWGYGLWATPDSASLSWRLPLFIFVACVLVLELCKNYRTYRQAKN